MSSRPHPFDRYAPFTDVDALKKISEQRLRKSVRVNTLKCSIERFQGHAKEQGWQLEPVPWCPEGFFLERFPNAPHPNPLPQREREYKALGRDLLHLLGHFYMQEAASMLPVALLDPQPGETILDMSAAPGSKTTQIAARMGDRGVVVANDVQEKRLWTLKSALHRSGVRGVIVTKKVGQWFGRNMTERFDRVLCDAPCTAQGTARKDSDALVYSSEGNVLKMARLQQELLESAVHAAKVGGTIVYSTCTLTPEENELVVSRILAKFPDQLEAVRPEFPSLEAAISDSEKVQEYLSAQSSLSTVRFPFVRLWPHVHDVEGFFAAVLRKTKPTKHPEEFLPVPFQEVRLPPARQDAFGKTLEERFGAPLLIEDDVLFERGEDLQLASRAAADFALPIRDYSLGLPFGRRIAVRDVPIDEEGTVARPAMKHFIEGKVRLGNEVASLRGGLATKSVVDLDDQTLDAVLSGADIPCDPALAGDCVLRWRDIPVGLGLARDGTLKNRLSRWVVLRS